MASRRDARFLRRSGGRLPSACPDCGPRRGVPELFRRDTGLSRRVARGAGGCRRDATLRAFDSSAARRAQVPPPARGSDHPLVCPSRALSRSESVRNWSASAGFLDSPAQGTYQACVARGRRELLAAAPTPLLRQSPLESFKERIALAHAAPYCPPGQGASACASAGTTRSRRCASFLPSDRVQTFSVIAGSYLKEVAPLAVVCGGDCCGPWTTSRRLRRRIRLGHFGPPNARRRTGVVPPWADGATWRFARI